MKLLIRQKFYTAVAAVFICSLVIYSCSKIDSFHPVTSSNLVSHANTSSGPNIVFILLDDVGFEVPTCYGGQSYETPYMDRMAQEGMRFTQFYGSPLCSPSRFMLLTGKYNFRNYTIWGEMNPDEKTLATLLKDAGYATYVAGKWQLDGGDSSIHSLGFDDYSVWLPFADVSPGPHYKSPKIYEKGNYLSSEETRDKFGDDIFTNRILSFIDSNKTNKFFVYFPITLSHSPFVPTPDDPEFKTWGLNNGSDTSFFSSMVKYMDKKIGEIIDHLKQLGLYDNTIVMVAGDNGTSGYIYSTYQGSIIKGGKGRTNIYGTKLPLLITLP